MSRIKFSGGGVDFLLLSIHLAGLSSLVGSVNFILSLLGSKARKDLSRVQVLAWSYIFTSALLLLSLPVLARGITMLLFDRNLKFCFFDPAGGGDPILFQHLF